MKKLISIFSLAAVSFSLNGATTQDILAYNNSGDTVAWYHELIREAYDAKTRSAVEKTVLDAMKNPKISDDAFRLSAKIMKYAATEKSMPELLKLATKPNRVGPVFDVLISAEYPSVDNLLIGAVKNSRDEDVLIHAVYALGSRGTESAVVPVWELAKKSKPELANACVTALGHIPSFDSHRALADLAKSKKGDPFLLNYALSQQREMFVRAGKQKEANAISTPDGFVPGLMSLAASQPNAAARMKFLDKNIIDPKLPGRHAARIANEGRTFENSGDLVKAYPKLEDGAKVAAIRSFALSGDTRFYDVIKADVKDSGELANREAIFACAYIAPDSAVSVLEQLLDSRNRDVRIAATYALTTMPSPEVDKILKKSYAKSKSPAVLDILLDRGNTDMRDELFKRMFDAKDSNRREIMRIFENQVGFGGLKKTFEMMKKADDGARRDALASVIKFVMKDPKSQHRMLIYKEYFEGSGLKEDELELVKSRFDQRKK